MTLTAVYASDLSRVRLNFSSAPAAADYALIERSTDSVNWVTVRGGATVPINAGSGKIDDYEFEAGKANTYRASYVDTGAIFGVVATAGDGSGSSQPPTTLGMMPAGVVPGDLVLVLASIANSGVGTVNTPPGYTPLLTSGNMSLFGRRNVAGDPAPSVTFTGGGVGISCVAVTCKVSNAEMIPLTSAAQLNASASDIAFPAITDNTANTLYMLLGWKDGIFNGTVTSGTTTSLHDSSFSGKGMAWLYKLYPAAGPGNIPAGVMAIAGTPVTAISRGAALAFNKAAYVTRDTATLTPAPGSIWIKNPSRPGQNTPITVTEFSDVTRPDRGTELDVVGRTMPVAITDVFGSRRMSITITTSNLSAAADMDRRLATGETIFLQAPDATCPIPTMYAVIKGTVQSRNSKRTTRRYFDLPLVEVAAPGSTVTGDTILYMDLPTTWATYADLLAAKATYSDVIDSISTGVVIVP